jgi:hypothetical protein
VGTFAVIRVVLFLFAMIDKVKWFQNMFRCVRGVFGIHLAFAKPHFVYGR